MPCEELDQGRFLPRDFLGGGYRQTHNIFSKATVVLSMKYSTRIPDPFLSKYLLTPLQQSQNSVPGMSGDGDFKRGRAFDATQKDNRKEKRILRPPVVRNAPVSQVQMQCNVTKGTSHHIPFHHTPPHPPPLSGGQT